MILARHRIAAAFVAALMVGACTTAAPTAAPTQPPTQAPTDAPEPTDAQEPTGAPSGDAVIGFSQANGGDEWRINQTQQVEEWCPEYNPGAEVLVSDAQGDDNTQSTHIDEFVARPVDVLLLTPNTADLIAPAAQRALDAEIPVITLDRSVNAEVTQHIGADNKLIGRTAAEYVSQTILGGQGGQVLEMQGTQGASATIDRHDEFVAWLEENDTSVEIVTSQDADYKREEGLVLMNDWLQAYPDGDYVVYTHNDAMALGAVEAIETAGQQDRFKVVGIDGQEEAIQAIADGKIVVTFTYDRAGKEACESASKLLAGEELDPVWTLPTNTIDAANVEEFLGTGF
jgi:ribose transport system substrate-binding protein